MVEVSRGVHHSFLGTTDWWRSEKLSVARYLSKCGVVLPTFFQQPCKRRESNMTCRASCDCSCISVVDTRLVCCRNLLMQSTMIL